MVHGSPRKLIHSPRRLLSSRQEVGFLPPFPPPTAPLPSIPQSEYEALSSLREPTRQLQCMCSSLSSPSSHFFIPSVHFIILCSFLPQPEPLPIRPFPLTTLLCKTPLFSSFSQFKLKAAYIVATSSPLIYPSTPYNLSSPHNTLLNCSLQ